MPPLVRQQLRQRKRRQLGIARAESDECHGYNHCRVALSRAPDDEADEEQDIPRDDEPPATEEIRVGAADPGGRVSISVTVTGKYIQERIGRRLWDKTRT